MTNPDNIFLLYQDGKLYQFDSTEIYEGEEENWIYELKFLQIRLAVEYRPSKKCLPMLDFIDEFISLRQTEKYEIGDWNTDPDRTTAFFHKEANCMAFQCTYHSADEDIVEV